MNILLDTHIALWSIADSKKLSEECANILQDENNEFYVSIASIWEVAVKHRLHPDEISMSEFDYAQFCDLMSFNILPVKLEHIFTLRTLTRQEDAPKHNDPFDRIMIAQAKHEKFSFLTHDKLLPLYNESCILYI
ncbi:MAG: type II toxin-antitoxin system VapC family toxin [Synergistaceae bacterium]|nr:type II toxin-antitoxin system VapC family toxin [Synergistaceae bacterium]MBR1602787.1 type II toxin-antitoxin system VapC family toxin [Synergistaceae bacterium]